MREFNHTTCVKFVPRISQENYITINLRPANPHKGCSSDVGMQNNGSQEVWFSRLCMERNDILHELMHVLGFIHEQNRADRGDYIEIRLDNVHPDKRKNFNIRPLSTITHLNTKYDFKSVMHYDKYAWSQNGKETIVPKRSDVVIEANGLSRTDIQRIKRLYGCNGKKKNKKNRHPVTPVINPLPSMESNWMYIIFVCF